MSRPNNKHDRREKDNKNNINPDRQDTKRVLPYKRPKSNRRSLLYDPLVSEETDDVDDEDITDG